MCVRVRVPRRHPCSLRLFIDYFSTTALYTQPQPQSFSPRERRVYLYVQIYIMRGRGQLILPPFVLLRFADRYIRARANDWIIRVAVSGLISIPAPGFEM